MILASHYRYRRSKHLISNLFPLFFSSLLVCEVAGRRHTDIAHCADLRPLRSG
jgi:hypothetical protein